MFELNRTHARRAFKDLLGQANHFLITILVGLNGVRNESVRLEVEFRTSWNPKNVQSSADRSRAFVLDLALIRAIDALDTYMMMSARKPCALPNTEFAKKMNSTGRSVAKRLDLFDSQLERLEAHHKAILVVAIEWRNRRVHSLASDKIDHQTLQLILAQETTFRDHYSGLNVKELIAHFNAGNAPTFKEVASVIRLVHEAVAHFDEFLLWRLPIESYLSDALLQLLGGRDGEASKAIQKTWDHPKKDQKIIRLLRMVGVNETETIRGRQVPNKFVSKLLGLESAEVLDFIKDQTESA